MLFKKLTFTERIKNFERLTTNPKLIEIMSAEYARLINTNPIVVNTLMLDSARNFSAKFQRKKTIKRNLKFWKN